MSPSNHITPWPMIWWTSGIWSSRAVWWKCLLGFCLLVHNFPIFDSFSDKVILYINVLGPSVEFVVLWQCNCPLIVTIKCDQITVICIKNCRHSTQKFVCTCQTLPQKNFFLWPVTLIVLQNGPSSGPAAQRTHCFLAIWWQKACLWNCCTGKLFRSYSL